MTPDQERIVADIRAIDALPKRSLTEELVEKREHLLALLRIEGDLHLLPEKIRLEAMKTRAKIELVPRKFRNKASVYDYEHDRIADERSDLNDPDRIRARKLAHKVAAAEHEQRLRELRGDSGGGLQVLLGLVALVVVGFLVLNFMSHNGGIAPIVDQIAYSIGATAAVVLGFAMVLGPIVFIFWLKKWVEK